MPGLERDVTALQLGWQSACAVIGGHAKCWGVNAQGQLGNGTTVDAKTPVEAFIGVDGITAVALSFQNSCVLTAAGAVYCAGDNLSGELGDGTRTARTTVVEVVGLTGRAVGLAATGEFTCALIADGTVQCWGIEGAAPGAATVMTMPQAVGPLRSDNGHVCVQAITGDQYCWGFWAVLNGDWVEHTEPAVVAILGHDVAQWAAGSAHTCVLNDSGAVQCWGLDTEGQVGGGATTNIVTVETPVMGLQSGVRQIAAGSNHSCALLEDDHIECWGGNRLGQLGDGTVENRNAPVDVGVVQ